MYYHLNISFTNTTQHHVFLRRVNELRLEKDRHSSKVAETDKIITELQALTQQHHMEDQQSIQAKDAELTSLRLELTRRGERYTETLNVIQICLRELRRDAGQLTTKLGAVTAQVRQAGNEGKDRQAE